MVYFASLTRLQNATFEFKVDDGEDDKYTSLLIKMAWHGIKSVIQFCYTGEYPNLAETIVNNDWGRHVEHHLWVFKQADYMQCDELRQHSAKRFVHSAADYLDAVKSQNWVSSFIQALYVTGKVATAEYINLRRWVALKEFNRRVQKLKIDNDYKGICDIMTAAPSAAADFFQFAAEVKDPRLKVSKEWDCVECREVFRYFGEAMFDSEIPLCCNCADKGKKNANRAKMGEDGGSRTGEKRKRMAD